MPPSAATTPATSAAATTHQLPTTTTPATSPATTTTTTSTTTSSSTPDTPDTHHLQLRCRSEGPLAPRSLPPPPQQQPYPHPLEDPSFPAPPYSTLPLHPPPCLCPPLPAAPPASPPPPAIPTINISPPLSHVCPPHPSSPTCDPALPLPEPTPSSPPPYASTDPLLPSIPAVIAAKPWHSDSVSYAGEQLDVQNMLIVFDFLASNSSVKLLHLAGNNVAITDEIMPALARSLRFNSCLVHLNLAACSISVRGAAALGIALRTNSSIATLLVQDNAFLEEGAAAFARALAGPSRSAQNTSLVSLNLSGNAILDSGFAALANAVIKSLPNLRDLSLAANAITDTSAMLIAHLVAAHPSLERLYLQENRIGNATILALDRVIRPDSHIRLVNLLVNCISLRSNSIFNKSRIWWKHKHQVRYGQLISQHVPSTDPSNPASAAAAAAANLDAQDASHPSRRNASASPRLLHAVTGLAGGVSSPAISSTSESRQSRQSVALDPLPLTMNPTWPSTFWHSPSWPTPWSRSSWISP